MRSLQMLTMAGLASGLMFQSSVARAAEPSLRWLGHAAFEFTTRNGKIILIDPWITNPKAPKNISFTHLEGILITHAHSDHVGEAFELAKKYNAPIVACYELASIAEKKGVKKILPINASGTQKIDDVSITAVPAVHSSGFQDGDHTIYGGAPLGYVVQEDGALPFYHAGDTGVFSDMGLIAELYHPNVALLPIGGVFTMKPAEAAVAVRLLQVRAVVPMHFGTFPALSGTTDELRTELKRLGVPAAVKEMTPGQTMTLTDLAKS